MPRTPSRTPAECEAMLGTRGHIRVDSTNRGIVKQWLTAQGFPALFVGGLSMTELGLAYNQTDGSGLDKIRRKLAETQDDMPEETQASAFQQAAAADIEALTPKASNGHANGSGNGVDSIANAIRAAIQGAIPQSSGIDRAAVCQIIREELPGLIPTTRIELCRNDVAANTLEGHHHANFPTLMKMLAARDASGFVPNVFLQGEASSGKTTACKHAAKALGLTWRFNGAISMPHEMLGFIDAGGTYHRTPFRDAYEHGGVYTFDEVDRSDNSALLAVNPHLANGLAQFPDRMVERHKDCIIIGTANTWGLGADANYAGAAKLDAAFMSRFSGRLNWDIDESLERDICGNAQWARRVQNARAKARAAGLKVMIDVRMSVTGAAYIAQGMDEETVARITYLANLKPEQRRIIEG